MGSPQALLMPFPAQGHVIPLMELAYCLIERGFKITFINTEFNHKRVATALSEKGDDMGQINLVKIPDGLEPGDDRNNIGRLIEGLLNVMPGCLEELIRNANEMGEEKITCFIVDWTMTWILEIAQKMGLWCAVFWPSIPEMLVAALSTSKLIEDGIIKENGNVMREEIISLGPGMLSMNSAHLLWNCFSDCKSQKIMYDVTIKNNQMINIANFLICNSFCETKLPAFISAPKILPVGPLHNGRQAGKPVGHFWPEDTTSMAWLDQQPSKSVIYVAFGSFTIFSQHQFEELALGLELSGRPFLWAVRSDHTDHSSYAYPHGFRERVATQGKIVSWSPQQAVLAHPSIACFISHCGWNSTTEGVTNGIPFLSWPYFADQFLNESCICDVWKIGLRLTPEDNGIISREQIKSKIDDLLGNEEIITRALALKEEVRVSVSKGGLSYKNLNILAEAMKEHKPVKGE